MANAYQQAAAIDHVYIVQAASLSVNMPVSTQVQVPSLFFLHCVAVIHDRNKRR